MKRKWTSSGWVNKSFYGCLRNNYSLLDILFGRWRYRPSKYKTERMMYLNFSQRHQVKSRFL